MLHSKFKASLINVGPCFKITTAALTKDVLGRQRQPDLCEIEVSLVYRVSSRAARAVI